MATLIGQMLCVALLVWWLIRQQQADPVVSVCPSCGDLVQHTPGLPSRCPSCRTILI